MMNLRLALILMLLLNLTTATIASAEQKASTHYDLETTRQTVALVEDAVSAIATQGEAVFAEFRRDNSRWYQGDRYVFVWDLAGNRYVYPPDLEHEKQNMLGLKDAGGKPIGRMFVDTAASERGKGWVHYQWNRPHDLLPLWKSTYIMRAQAPSSKTYLVGSGVYQGGMEKAFLVEEVEAAAALIRQRGKAAFSTLRDPTSRFFFHDTYVFVTAADGTELVNPAFPGIEGRNLWDSRDSRGNFIVRDYIKQALEKGHGWSSYYWPRPGSSREARKTTYVKKVSVDGEDLIIGAGMYD